MTLQKQTLYPQVRADGWGWHTHSRAAAGKGPPDSPEDPAGVGRFGAFPLCWDGEAPLLRRTRQTFDPIIQSYGLFISKMNQR